MTAPAQPAEPSTGTPVPIGQDDIDMLQRGVIADLRTLGGEEQ